MNDKPQDVLPAEPDPERSDRRRAEPPKRRGPLFWVLLIGGIVVGLSCIGCAGVVWWIYSAATRYADEQLQAVHRDALGDGDVKAAYENADPAFKQRYSRDDFEKFARANPNLFERSKLKAAGFTIIPSYRMVRVNVEGRADPVEIVCRVADGGALLLLGIIPDLDAAIPADVMERLRSAGKEGGRKRDWFDD